MRKTVTLKIYAIDGLAKIRGDYREDWVLDDWQKYIHFDDGTVIMLRNPEFGGVKPPAIIQKGDGTILIAIKPLRHNGEVYAQAIHISGHISIAAASDSPREPGSMAYRQLFDGEISTRKAAQSWHVKATPSRA